MAVLAILLRAVSRLMPRLAAQKARSVSQLYAWLWAVTASVTLFATIATAYIPCITRGCFSPFCCWRSSRACSTGFRSATGVLLHEPAEGHHGLRSHASGLDEGIDLIVHLRVSLVILVEQVHGLRLAGHVRVPGELLGTLSEPLAELRQVRQEAGMVCLHLVPRTVGQEPHDRANLLLVWKSATSSLNIFQVQSVPSDERLGYLPNVRSSRRR